MLFSLFTLLGSAALAAANSITFKSLDDNSRHVYFVANAGLAEVDSVEVPGMASVTVEMPYGWIGNWYSVSEDADATTGMLGEVTFNGWNGLTYFDVSAIVDANDMNGVKKMYPAIAKTPVSGCDEFPCNEAYYLPDDVQTKVTNETDLVCTLANNGVVEQRDLEHVETPSVKRDFVLGKF